jgi:transposase
MTTILSFGAAEMENVLNLPRYNVLSVKEETHDYHIDAETAIPPDKCLECGSDNIVGGGRQEILIKDLPMHGKRVGIYVKARRFRCRDCGKTTTERLPHVADGQRMTDRLHTWICRESVNKTFTGIAHEVGVSEGTVRAIFGEYVKNLEDQVVFETPQWMGIDEIHIIRKPRLVISNIENCTVVDMLADRSKTIVTNYLMRLPSRNSIKCVTMDMWKPYKDAVNGVLPQAFIVVDKFHVLRMANQALEVIRKNIRADLTTKQRRGLMHDRFLLLKRESQLESFERLSLETWTNNFPALGKAYRAKEEFFRMYDAMSIPEAQTLYAQWKNSLSPAIREAFSPLTTAMNNWENEIMAYFEHPATNAYTESLNNLIRAVNRCGRGYSFEALRAKMLFSKGAHKIVVPPFKRRPVRDDRCFERMSFSMGYESPSTETLQPAKNYGVVTSTLLKLIEEGKL